MGAASAPSTVEKTAVAEELCLEVRDAAAAVGSNSHWASFEFSPTATSYFDFGLETAIKISVPAVLRRKALVESNPFR